MQYPAKILVFVLLGVPTVSTAKALPTQYRLENALKQAKSKNYETAIQKTKPLLDNLKLDTVGEIITAHKVLGVSYCELGDQTKAKEHFKALVAFSPQESIQDLVVSNPCKNLYMGIQEKEAMASLGVSTPELKKNTQPVVVETLDIPELTSRSSLDSLEKENPMNADLWKRFIPFGVGQFANQEPQKGYTFLATEALAVVSGATAFTLFQVGKNDDGTFSNPGRASLYRTMYWSSLGVGSVALVWGIVDAVVKFNRKPKAQATASNHQQNPILLSFQF